MNITHILELLKELEALLKKYGDQSIVYQYRTLQDAIAVLEADYSDEDKSSILLLIV